MADCPNCGRQTLRTKDWACQWCGYPLVTGTYKVIDRTYKELQEERSLTSKPAGLENKPEPEPEPRTEPPVKPVSIPRPEPKPSPRPQPSAVPPPEPVLRQSPPVQPVLPPSPEPIPPPVQPAAPVPPPPSKSEVPPEPAPLITPPPAPRPQLPPEPKPELIIEPGPVPESITPPPEPEPELIIEPEPIPEPAIKLEEIQDGMEITAEQIDALFRKEKDAADSALTDKTLVIKGVVEKVFVREHLDIRYIILTGASKRMTWSLRCTFNKEESPKLTRLQEGQAVVVQGKYESVSKNIIFKDCVLV